MKSWQTTLAGIAAIVAAIANAIVAQFDTEPLTVPDWPLVVAAVAAGIGLTRARDNDKSSEDVGTKPRKYSGYTGIVPLLLLACLCMAGCAANVPTLPTTQDQKADEIGPATVIVNQGVLFYSGQPTPTQKVAESVNFSAQTASVDQSQQGSSRQEARQAGGRTGNVQQDPKADLKVTPGP